MFRLHSCLGREGSYGWGVLTHNLHREFARSGRCALETIEAGSPRVFRREIVDGHLLQAVLGDVRRSCHLRGRFNHGLGFFDHPLHESAVVRARKYDRIFVGSRWCAEHLRAAGIENAVPFVQGIDTRLFRPGPGRSGAGGFVVFSGGKFEHRKGQDLVIAAMARFQRRCPEAILVTQWGNYLGAEGGRTMAASPHLRMEAPGDGGEEWSRRLCAANGLDPERTVCLPSMPHEFLPEVYRNTDIGLFPNRCEAGTNLVLAEYQACGRPVIASFQFGQRDVLDARCAFLLEPRHHLGTLAAEPDVDEVVAALEEAYRRRDPGGLEAMGAEAAEAMRAFTWEAAARTILDAIGTVEEIGADG